MEDFQEKDQEHAVVAKAAAGDREAFGLLVERHAPKLFQLAWMLTGSRDAADDATQEAFLKAYEKLRTFRQERPFYPWLAAICVNAIRSRSRREGVAQRMLAAFGLERARHESAAPSAESDAVGDESRDALRKALAALPLPQREAVTLRFFEEMAFGEMAQLLGVSTATAKMRTYRGVAALKTLLVTENAPLDPWSSDEDD